MTEHTINNLQEVLNGYIKNDMEISDTKIKPLTVFGDNFGSVMLQLDVTLKKESDGTEEEIHAVAKKIPDLEETRKVFNIQVTFKNEIAMYVTIVPTLKEFQRENGVKQIIDCFAEFYGARINLGEENGTVDEDAVLILENLKAKEYQVVNRFRGFDLDTAQLILKDLAGFHAISLALKLRKPEVFAKKIKPYLAPFSPPSMPNKEELNATIIECLQDSNKCIPWISKIKKIYQNEKAIRQAPPREPFATLTHGDMWTNNTMIKFKNGVPVHNKLIDFQVCDYKSPATDVFFFLFSSVQQSVLQDDLDGLIQFYHKHFIEHLKTLKCDVTQFSFPKFLEEMKAAATAEMTHTIGMTLFIVFGKHTSASKNDEKQPRPDFEKMKENLDLVAVEKIRFMVHACGKRGWL